MPGKITRISVTYTVDDLTVICEDLIAAQEPAPGNGLDGLPGRTR
jgi:hypothetical protein